MTIITTKFTQLKNIFADQKQQFHIKLNKERERITESRAELLKAKKNYSCIEDLESNLEDGTFSTVLDGVHLEGFFRQKEGKNHRR